MGKKIFSIQITKHHNLQDRIQYSLFQNIKVCTGQFVINALDLKRQFL